MIDKQKIRLKNLKLLVANAPSIAAFSRNHGLDQTYISQLLNGYRQIGEKAARKLEDKIGLQPDWLDREAGADQSPLALQDVLLTPRQRAMLRLFDGLTQKQQEELIGWAEGKARENREVVNELGKRQGQAGKRGRG